MSSGTVSDGLPRELATARPSGFLGRHFAAMHADLRLPGRLMDWSDHHILLAMSRRGEDLPGSLMIGDESFARRQALDIPATTRDAYPDLARATIAGYPPGSSAGGERPKFGAFVDGHHVLVKFAARGIPAAQTSVIDIDSHCFLESRRFDRVGIRGRVAVLSLAAVHDDPADTWARAAVRLRETGRLSSDDARRLQWLDAFGMLIANTDRHPYNVIFFADRPALRLAPAFDQTSALYSPTDDGQVPPRVFAPPRATAETLEVWDDARAAGREFWQQAADDARVSDDVRRIAAAHAAALDNRRLGSRSWGTCSRRLVGLHCLQLRR